MARMIFGVVFSVLFLLVGSPLVAQSSLNLPNQSSSAIPKLDLPTSGQPFFSLIEDAIVKKPQGYPVTVELPVEVITDSQIRTCKLNAPCTGVCQSKCKGSCHSNSGIVCSSEECEEACKVVDETVAKITGPTDQYCEQMAGLLANTLSGSDMSPSQIRAIEEAMKMVAAKAREDVVQEMDQVAFEYEDTIEQLRSKMNHMSIVNDSNEDFKAWLHPIYTNQTKTFEQLRALAQSKAMINRRLEQIEARLSIALGSTSSNKQVPGVEFGTNLTRTDGLDSNRPGNEPLAFQKSTIVEGENLRNELKELQARLDRLQPQHSSNIRKAGYLEPIYSQDQRRQMEPKTNQRLQPIEDPNQSSYRYVPRLPIQQH